MIAALLLAAVVSVQPEPRCPNGEKYTEGYDGCNQWWMCGDVGGRTLRYCGASQPAPHLRLRTTIPILTAGVALDLASTEWAFAQGPGIREAGIGQTTIERVVLQSLYLGAELAVVHTVDRKAGRKWGKRTLIGLTVLKVGIVGWNIHQGRKAAAHSR